ncbi:hypothetical protein PoB_002380900 [Plakobranchus ocellatus]|uniref:Uncharacterized protein n=1 Tax=Plakobranchus ocellatus TaxID=259542 RepID=A0AAV3ZPR1_9GAST|nr:hypothetical protein PoB_002380900 [Plakobranchus ocellatus]
MPLEIIPCIIMTNLSCVSLGFQGNEAGPGLGVAAGRSPRQAPSPTWSGCLCGTSTRPSSYSIVCSLDPTPRGTQSGDRRIKPYFYTHEGSVGTCSGRAATIARQGAQRSVPSPDGNDKL